MSDAAPVMESVDALLIDDLSDDEDEAFAAALNSCGSSLTPACSAPRSAGVDVRLSLPTWQRAQWPSTVPTVAELR